MFVLSRRLDQYYCSLLLLSHQSINATLYYILFVCVCFLFPFILDRHQVRWTLLFVVVFFTLLTDRASTVPSNIRGCQFDTWSAGQKNIRGTSTKLQREQNQKQKTKNKTKQNRNDKKKGTITKIHMPEKDRTSRGHTGGRSHRIFHAPSFCGACLNFSREKDSAIPFPRRP